MEGDRDGERQSLQVPRDRQRVERERYQERAGQGIPTLIPHPAPAVPASALPTSSLAVLVTPSRPSLSPHHSGWATVKRRCRRMLWFTRNFLKSPGEPRGEPWGEPGPGAAEGAGGPCIAETAWTLHAAQAERDLFWTAAGAGPGGRGQRARRPRLAAGPLLDASTGTNGETEALRWPRHSAPFIGGGGWPRGPQSPDLMPLPSAKMSPVRTAFGVDNLAEKSEMRKSEREASSIVGGSQRHGVYRGAAQISHSVSSTPLPIFHMEKTRPGATRGCAETTNP